MAEIGQLRLDGGQPSVTPVMRDLPGIAFGDLVAQAVTALLAAGDLPGGASDVAVEAFDVVESGALLVAAMAAQQRERSDAGESVVGSIQAVFGPVVLLLGGAQLVFGSPQFTAAIGWSTGEDGLVFGLFGEEPLDALGIVMGGEAGVGQPEQGIEHFPVGAALVGEDAPEVHIGEATLVPQPTNS